MPYCYYCDCTIPPAQAHSCIRTMRVRGERGTNKLRRYFVCQDCSSRWSPLQPHYFALRVMIVLIVLALMATWVLLIR